MKKQIKTKELKYALEAVKPGLANRELIEQTTSFVFLDGRLVTYNDEISISYPVPELKGITGAVPSKKLYDFINKVKKDTINIELNNNEIIIKCGSTRAGLVIEQEIKLPLDEPGEIQNFEPIPTDFAEAVRLVSQTASKDTSNFTLTGIYCHNYTMETTDNWRISQYGMASEFPFEFIVSANALIKVINQPITEIAQTDGWVHFRTEQNAIISCRTIEGVFPNTSTILDNFKMSTKITLPKNIEEIIERARTIVTEENKLHESITIELRKGEIRISGKSDYGWIKDRERTDYKGEDVTFHATPTLLLDIIKKTNRVGKINKERTQLLFEKDNWTFLTMLRHE